MDGTILTDMKKIFLQNPRSLLSRKQLRSLISDVYMNDAASINVLLTAYDIGIVDEMRTQYPLDEFDKARLKMVLVKQHSIIDDRARWAVDTWTSMFDASVAQALLKTETDDMTSQEASSIVESETPEIALEQINDESEELLYDFQSKCDDDSYYINPSLEEMSKRIYVPCGLGDLDNGFFIYGIKKTYLCEHPQANIYALVYNLMLRNSKMTDDDIPQYIKNIDSLYEIDYKVVFRIAILILQMIKNNYLHGAMLEVYLKGETDSFKYAVALINHYADRFSRLMKAPFTKLQVHNSSKGHPICLEGDTGIYVRDNNEFISNAREIWYGKKINYRLTRADLPDMESLLADISPFDTFKEGQYDALCKLLVARRHGEVCSTRRNST